MINTILEYLILFEWKGERGSGEGRRLAFSDGRLFEVGAYSIKYGKCKPFLEIWILIWICKLLFVRI